MNMMYPNNYYQPSTTQLRTAANGTYINSNVVPQQSYNLRGRPVASFDEVKATTIDFDGSVFFFPDLANKRIYTKQINIDGTPSYNVYELKDIPLDSSNSPNGDYVTRKEFETVLGQIKNMLEGKAQQTAPNVMNMAEQPIKKEEFNF